MDSKLRCTFEMPLENDKTVSLTFWLKGICYLVVSVTFSHIPIRVTDSQTPHCVFPIKTNNRTILIPLDVITRNSLLHYFRFCSVCCQCFPICNTSLITRYLFMNCVCSFTSCPATSLHVFLSLYFHSTTLHHPSLSLHSMRVKATKLCLPLPPLLRLTTLCCPSRPAPRWMMARWRRSWKSASGCRWRCRGYGKKTCRSGWVTFVILSMWHGQFVWHHLIITLSENILLLFL